MAAPGQWSHGLFGCFDDFGLCIISYLFPCVTFGQTAEALGKGSCVMCGLAMFVPLLNLIMWVKIRGQLREMKGIPGSCFGDLMTIACCGICALVQEAQEVRGAAPSAQSMSRE